MHSLHYDYFYTMPPSNSIRTGAVPPPDLFYGNTGAQLSMNTTTGHPQTMMATSVSAGSRSCLYSSGILPQSAELFCFTGTTTNHAAPIPYLPRTHKRRFASNKKERRRTVSINAAFAALRAVIPNVPSDTKLSKIKTLRLATSYIAYLMTLLKDTENDSCPMNSSEPTGDSTDTGREASESPSSLSNDQEVSSNCQYLTTTCSELQPLNSTLTTIVSTDKRPPTGIWPKQLWVEDLK